MNTPKIGSQQNYGMLNNYTLELANPSSNFLGPPQQPSWNMGICTQSSQAMEVGGSQQLNFSVQPEKVSSTIMSRFESPASSAFCATERYMGFQQNEFQVGGNPYLCSQFSRASTDSQIESYQSSTDKFSVDDDSVEQADPSFQFRDTLESVAKSQLCSNQSYSSEKSFKIPCSNFPANELFVEDQNKLLSNNVAMNVGHCLIPFDGKQDLRVCGSSFNPQLAQLSFSSQHENLFSRPSSCGSHGGNCVSMGAVHSSKTRIRWTQDLHEKFLKCVNCLGGAEKATPKAILKLMDSDGLTIFHVKSHLQKYRIAKYMPESAEGKFEKRTSVTEVPQLDMRTGLQIKEALQLQLDVQRQLHDQLEIQRNLQLRIEEQGKQLKMMFDQQQRTNMSQFKPRDDIAESSENTIPFQD